MSTNKNYEPLTGIAARLRLNKIGYNVLGCESKDTAILSLIVALAEHVETLEKRINKQGKKSQPEPMRKNSK